MVVWVEEAVTDEVVEVLLVNGGFGEFAYFN